MDQGGPWPLANWHQLKQGDVDMGRLRRHPHNRLCNINLLQRIGAFVNGIDA